jgi:hypothetical protein
MTGMELDERQVEGAFARKIQAPDPIGVKRTEYSRDVEGILSELERHSPGSPLRVPDPQMSR